MNFWDRFKKRYNLDRIDALFLGIALSVGSVFRIIGFNWGKNAIYQPDEYWMVDPVIQMAETRRLLFDRFYYPAQSFSKLQAVIVIIFCKLFGIEIRDDQVIIYYICRLIVCIFGVMTVFVTFLIGNYLHKRLGTCSALLLSVSPFMTLMAKQDTGDVNVLFCGSVTMLCALRYSEEQRKRFLILMSMFAAIATMEKWHGGAAAVLVGVFILIYANSVKDFFIRGLGATISFLAAMIIISPNIIKVGPMFLIENFFDIAVYEGDKGPGYLSNLLAYAQYSYNRIGGILYIMAILVGVLVVLWKRDKRYLILSLGIIKVLILGLLNRTMLRWGLELYYCEIILIAAAFVFFISNKSKIVNGVAFLLGIIILSENVLSSTLICEAASRYNQDVRFIQEKYCEESGITPDNSACNYYTAYDPGGIPHRAKMIADWDLENVFELVDDKLYKEFNVDYLICGSRMFWSGAESLYGIREYRTWECKASIPDVFNIPFSVIDQSYNDLKLCGNYLNAIASIWNGANVGAYDIIIYDISGVPLLNSNVD